MTTNPQDVYHTETTYWRVHFKEGGEWWDDTTNHRNIKDASETVQRLLNRPTTQGVRIIKVVTTETEVTDGN